VAINGKTPQFLDTLVAAGYLGAKAGLMDESTESTFAQLDFSDKISVDFQVDITGNVATKAVSLEGKELPLSKIELNGVGIRFDQKPM